MTRVFEINPFSTLPLYCFILLITILLLWLCIFSPFSKKVKFLKVWAGILVICSIFGMAVRQDVRNDERVLVVGDHQRAAGDGQRAAVAFGAAHILRHAAAGVGVELAVALLDLRDGAVGGAASAGSGEDALAGRDVELVVALVVGVGQVVGDDADDAAEDVQAGHDGSTVRQQLRLHVADLDAAVVEELLHGCVVDDGVSHVRGADQIRSAEAALGQHTDHGLQILQDLAAGGVPLGRRGVGRGVAGLGVETDLHLVGLVDVVGDVLHHAAVGQHGLGGDEEELYGHTQRGNKRVFYQTGTVTVEKIGRDYQ